MAKNILVTGGAGYIGSHMLKTLSQRGQDCLVLDDLSTGHAKNIKHGAFVQASLHDVSALDKIFARGDISAVIHFAASSIVSESVRNPAKYYQNNVIGTKLLLDAMARAQVPHLIFSSTAAVYGQPQVIPIPETHILNPINPYGATKLSIEMMLRDYAAAGLINYAALRYFNAAGADPAGEIGECHDPETHLIPIVLQAAAGERADVCIFGTDYETPDGTCLRDYIHVTDLCDAHDKALSYLQAGGESLCLNLGTGRGYSVREVIETVRRVTGKDFIVQTAPRRKGDPAALIADAKQAQQKLGWRAARSDLETIIRDAWAWEMKRASVEGK